MAENEAHSITRRQAAERLWRRSRIAAGCLRRCELRSVRPCVDGRPEVRLRGKLSDVRYLQQLCGIDKDGVPGMVDEAFADVLPQYSDWPRFVWELVDDLRRVA